MANDFGQIMNHDFPLDQSVQFKKIVDLHAENFVQFSPLHLSYKIWNLFSNLTVFHAWSLRKVIIRAWCVIEIPFKTAQCSRKISRNNPSTRMHHRGKTAKQF